MERFARILVVDDQPDIREALGAHLERSGFSVALAENASAARSLIESDTIDLVVLDIMMPGEDGLSLCRHLRETQNLPVILLTALTDDTDRIVGLELGADDYVTKPFNPRELVARIKAVLRRTQNPAEITQNMHTRRFGTWVLHLHRGELTDQDGTIVPLSAGEIQLLTVFLENHNCVLTRDELIDLTKGRDALPFERSVDNMISRLRRKIEPNPKEPIYIKTVWGGGYRFVTQSDAP
ncbi:response regulator [Parvibaculaceae bacterium PLY_AMNH_Bact1]|nr:response regulator [Parvibaculaceae bacterium PLY_AMNH_Bact1]